MTLVTPTCAHSLGGWTNSRHEEALHVDGGGDGDCDGGGDGDCDEGGDGDCNWGGDGDCDEGGAKALYTPGFREQSGVLKDSMIKVYLGYRNIDEILKLLTKI